MSEIDRDRDMTDETLEEALPVYDPPSCEACAAERQAAADAEDQARRLRTENAQLRAQLHEIRAALGLPWDYPLDRMRDIARWRARQGRALVRALDELHAYPRLP